MTINEQLINQSLSSSSSSSSSSKWMTFGVRRVVTCAHSSARSVVIVIHLSVTTAPRRRTLREVTPPTDFRGQRTMGEHATTTTTNEKTDKANASTSVLKQKYQALLESRNKVRRRRRDDAFERAWSCLFTQPMRFNPPCGCEWCTDLEKSRIARHDSTKKKPKNCAGR